MAWPPARLGRVRRWEAAAAMAVLGVHEHRVLGLPDGGLADHEAEGLAWAGGLLDEIEPDTILTFGPDGMTYHPDHIAVHRWVDRGVAAARLPGPAAVRHADRRAPRPVPRPLRGVEHVHERRAARPACPPPSSPSTCELDGHELDRKLTALRAMATQTRDLIALVGPETYATQVAEEGFIAAVAGLDEASSTPRRATSAA